MTIIVELEDGTEVRDEHEPVTVGAPHPPADWYGSLAGFCGAYSPHPDERLRTQCIGRPGHDDEHRSLTEDWIGDRCYCNGARCSNAPTEK